MLLANGGQPLELHIEGVLHPNVLDAYELLMGKDLNLPSAESSELLVYGGGETGCECAEYLAERGYKTTLISRSPAKQLARSAEMIYRGVLLQRLQSNPFITILDNTHIDRIDAEGNVHLRDAEQQSSTLKASKLFIAQGRRPDPTLGEQLLNAGIAYSSIGDARRGGRIGDAVNDAYKVVQSLCLTASTAKQLSC